MSKREREPGFAARHNSDCANCPVRINVGERVRWHKGRYVHIKCGPGGDDA